MKTKTKPVYYCEWCKKHALRTLAKHEKHCTMNPNRICRVCNQNNKIFFWVAKCKDELKTSKIINVQEIFKEVDGCPQCTFSIIRQAGGFKVGLVDFDYKKELEAWWASKNKNETVYDL